jgi:hypothetical protein
MSENKNVISEEAVEAAAPYMLARVWDEGRKHGETYPHGKRGLATDDTPHRSQA